MMRLKNVKGYLDTDNIELKPITILIGQNSSGKSSVMRFPLVLKQTILDDSMAPLLFFGRSIDYGSYDDVVFGHDPNREIEFEIKFDPSLLNHRRHYFGDSLLSSNKESLVLNLIVKKYSTTIKVERFIIRQQSGKEFLRAERTQDGTYDIFGHIASDATFRHRNLPLGFDKFLPDVRTIFEALQVQREKRREKVRTLDDFEITLFELYRFLGDYWSEFANKINYIGPFRRTPERAYRYRENAVHHLGGDGEFAPLILSQDMRTKGPVVSNVSQWLEENLGFRLHVDDLRGDMFSIMIEDVTTRVKNNIIDVGHGLSQLIPVVLQTFLATDSSLTVIEQPELHLHPAAQASLADLFINAIKPRNKTGPSFLIETHSEYLLLRLRRYIAEGKLRPSDLALYYSSKNGVTGSNSIKKLDIDRDGFIPDWPEGFFSQDYQETLLLQKAVMRQHGEDKYQW
ncbi:AAA family ATPase [Alicyclobacillus ferrooxydans]|nr:DUF3696 domain-containing protein [Alicyclobacillus ferrooxydans]